MVFIKKDSHKNTFVNVMPYTLQAVIIILSEINLKNFKEGDFISPIHFLGFYFILIACQLS